MANKNVVMVVAYYFAEELAVYVDLPTETAVADWTAPSKAAQRAISF